MGHAFRSSLVALGELTGQLLSPTGRDDLLHRLWSLARLLDGFHCQPTLRPMKPKRRTGPVGPAYPIFHLVLTPSARSERQARRYACPERLLIPRHEL